MKRFDPENQKPCARGCTWPQLNDDQEPEPKAARVNELLCDSCYYRILGALRTIPDLMANMRLQITPKAGASFIASGSHPKPSGAPVPLRLDPLDASDRLFAKLVSWTEVFAGELHTPQPSVAVWINFKEVQGSKPVTPERARELANQLVEWFTVRLDTITTTETSLTFHDDLCYAGWENDDRGVFSLAARYGIQPRPLRKAEKRECPICGRQEVFVAWPDAFNPDLRVMCGRCAWIAEPEKYGFYAELFKTA